MSIERNPKEPVSCAIAWLIGDELDETAWLTELEATGDVVLGNALFNLLVAVPPNPLVSPPTDLPLMAPCLIACRNIELIYYLLDRGRTPRS